MSAAVWFPSSESFRAGLARAQKNAPKATIYAQLSASKLTFRNADTNTWLAEVNR